MYIKAARIYYSVYRVPHMLSAGAWKDRLFRWWRKMGAESEQTQIDFATKLRINRQDGVASLELILVNDANMTVWVEDAIVALTDLDASWQTSIPPGKARHEIRQNVRANESLELSLANAIYDAAGRPQGRYSCLISVDVRCRVGKESFNKTLDPYKAGMTALMVLGLRRLRWYEKRVRPRDRPA
jgi:hypothetical protein